VGAEGGAGAVHQGDRVSRRPLLGAAHQPGDSRSGIRTGWKVLAEASVDQHARQCAWLDS
jgi:hypothetical protein